MRRVLDTDVVLSGLRSSVGVSRILLMAVGAGRVTPLVSVATVIEYEAVPKRAEHLAAMRLTSREIDRFLDALVAGAEAVDIRFTYRPSVRDPDDELFVAVAVNGGADALVTFNRRDYVASSRVAPPWARSSCR